LREAEELTSDVRDGRLRVLGRGHPKTLSANADLVFIRQLLPGTNLRY
jgi:hypothetical protein